jgi:hypothetical protein
MGTLSEAATRRLFRRTPLLIDPARGVAVKRSVHEVDVGCDAGSFAAAFAEVMREPDGRFGLIDVKRAPGREGREFEVGERFTGCVRLERTLRVGGWLARLSRTRACGWLEDAMMSDYAEVVEVSLAPPPGRPYRVVYRYLSGTPMAGSSTFLVEALGPRRCRFSAIFEYQELNGIAISIMHRFGVKLHDRVTREQAARAAARAGAQILGDTLSAVIG